MHMGLLALKVKIKSLADESRVIRKEELKLSGPERASLHNHRVIVVRRAARATLLAYAYIRGRSYRSTERGTDHRFWGWEDGFLLWKGVERMVAKYSEKPADNERLKAWRDTPDEALKAA